MSRFQFEWWDVQIRSMTGTLTWEFKGKDKEHVIRQINKVAADPEERIIEVFWDTLKLDRVGHQR